MRIGIKNESKNGQGCFLCRQCPPMSDSSGPAVRPLCPVKPRVRIPASPLSVKRRDVPKNVPFLGAHRAKRSAKKYFGASAPVRGNETIQTAICHARQSHLAHLCCPGSTTGTVRLPPRQ